MQYKIPQNVQIEDKIVGPITFRQLITLVVGGGITYMIYLNMAKQYYISVWIFFVLPPALITLALAFVRPLGVSFMQFILLLFEFYAIPRGRYWVKGADSVRPSIFTKVSEEKNVTKELSEDKHDTDRKKLRDLSEITKVLDSHGIQK